MDVPVLLMWWYIKKETLITKNVVSSKFQMAPFCECNKGRFPNFPPHLQRSVHAHPQLCTTVHGMREGGGGGDRTPEAIWGLWGMGGGGGVPIQQTSFPSCLDQNKLTVVISFLRSNSVLSDSDAVRPVYYTQSCLCSSIQSVAVAGSGSNHGLKYTFLIRIRIFMSCRPSMTLSSIRSVAVAGSGTEICLKLKYQGISYLLSRAELLDQEAVCLPLPLGLGVQESPPDNVVALPGIRRLHLGPRMVNHALQGSAVHGWLCLKQILICQTKDPEYDIFHCLRSSPLSIVYPSPFPPTFLTLFWVRVSG